MLKILTRDAYPEFRVAGRRYRLAVCAQSDHSADADKPRQQMWNSTGVQGVQSNTVDHPANRCLPLANGCSIQAAGKNPKISRAPGVHVA
jgi:hypothetical protein